MHITAKQQRRFSYRFSRDANENNALDGNEQFGFRIQNGALQMQRDADGLAPT